MPEFRDPSWVMVPMDRTAPDYEITVYQDTVRGPRGDKGEAGELVTVKAYGAKGDGHHDDTAAIQAALASKAQAVFFPPGTYNITSRLSATGPVTIEGWGATLVAADPADFTMLVVQGDHVSVSGLCFDGHYPSRTGASGDAGGIYVYGAHHVRIRDCCFLNIPVVGVGTNTAEKVWIEDCLFDNMPYSGVRFDQTRHRDLFVHNCTLRNTCLNHTPGHAAIFVDGDGQATDTAKSIHRIQITGNLIESCGKVGISVGGNYALVRGNHIAGGNSGGGGEAIALGGSDIMILDNQIRDYNQASGVLWFAMGALTNERLTVMGNDIRGCAQGVGLVWAGPDAWMRDIVISGNRMFDNAYGVQSYADPAGANQDWERIFIVNNVMVHNNQDYNLALADRVVLDNVTTQGRGDNNTIYARQLPLWVKAGVAGTADTVVGQHIQHLNQGPASPGSRLRQLLGFDLLPDRAIGGWEVEALNGYATSIALHALTTGDGYTSVYRPLSLYGSALSRVAVNQGYVELDDLATPPALPAAGKVRFFSDVDALWAGTSAGNKQLATTDDVNKASWFPVTVDGQTYLTNAEIEAAMKVLAEAPVYLDPIGWNGTGPLPNRGSAGTAFDAQLGGAGVDTQEPQLVKCPSDPFVYNFGDGQNLLSTENLATQPNTGLDVSVKFHVTTWPPAVQSILGAQWSTVNKWYFQILPSGQLDLLLNPGGAGAYNYSSTVAAPVTAGKPIWCRVTWRSSDGLCRFFTSPDGTVWTKLGADITNFYTGYQLGTTAQGFEVGNVGYGQYYHLIGGVYEARLRAAVDGPLIASFKAAEAKQAVGWTDSAGANWLIQRLSGHRTALVTRPMLSFTTDDYLMQPTSTALDFATTEDFTIVNAVRLFGNPSGAGGYGQVMNHAIDGGGQQGWNLGMWDTTRTPYFGINNTYVRQGPSGLGDGVLSTIWGQRRSAGTVMDCMVDGVPTAGVTIPATAITTTAPIIHGMSASGAYPVTMEWFGSALFRRALTAPEMKVIDNFFHSRQRRIPVTTP